MICLGRFYRAVYGLSCQNLCSFSSCNSVGAANPDACVAPVYVRGFARAVVRTQLFPLIEDFPLGGEVDFEIAFF